MSTCRLCGCNPSTLRLQADEIAALNETLRQERAKRFTARLPMRGNGRRSRLRKGEKQVGLGVFAPASARILELLLAHDICTYAMIRAHVMPKVPPERTRNNVGVRMCQLRDELSGSGVIIVTLPSVGYTMPAESKALLRSMFPDLAKTESAQSVAR